MILTVCLHVCTAFKFTCLHGIYVYMFSQYLCLHVRMVFMFTCLHGKRVNVVQYLCLACVSTVCLCLVLFYVPVLCVH